MGLISDVIQLYLNNHAGSYVEPEIYGGRLETDQLGLYCTKKEELWHLSQTLRVFLNIQQRRFPDNLGKDNEKKVGFGDGSTVFGLSNWNNSVEVL